MSQTAHLWENPEAVLTSIRVEIDAPASLVWDILLDMPRYPEWNPFCVECSSTLEMSAPVNMKLKSYIESTVYSAAEGSRINLKNILKTGFKKEN